MKVCNSVMRDTSICTDGMEMTRKGKRDIMALFRSRKKIAPKKEVEHLGDEGYDSLVSGFKELYMEHRNNRKETEQLARQDSQLWNYTWLHDFVRENYNNADNSKTKKDEPQYIANEFIQKEDAYRKSADSYSLCVNLDTFPPIVESGRSTSYLKPVFIDGCAVAQLYNPAYCPFFDVDRTADLPYTPCYKLNVDPLVKVIRHFLIRGHKVIIFLPKYYEKLYWLDLPRMCKVDDPDTFEVLRSLGVLEFIEPVDSESLTNEVKFFNDVMRERVKQANGCFVSSPHCEKMYERARKPNKPAECWNDERTNIDEAELQEKAMVTPHFFGSKKQLIMPLGTSLINGQVTTTGTETKNKFLYLDPETLLYYDFQFVSNNKSIVHGVQLPLRKQIETLLKLAGFYTLTSAEMFAMKIIFACGMHLPTRNLILDFVDEIKEPMLTGTSADALDSPNDPSESSEDDDFDINIPIDFDDNY